MEVGEKGVEKGFSDLMQAILERYHEEQVWSDKVPSFNLFLLSLLTSVPFLFFPKQIRSLSTYGTLAITSLNVFLFIITLLLVEPWKRKRLVEGVESRLRDNTLKSHQETLGTLKELLLLVEDGMGKLDAIVNTSPTTSSPSILMDLPPPVEKAATIVEEEELEEESLETAQIIPEERNSSLFSTITTFDHLIPLEERQKELLLVGVAGTAIGVGLSLLISLIGGQ